MSNVEIDVPLYFVGLDCRQVQVEFPAFVFQFSEVLDLAGETGRSG
jgi:hypothetical protein